MQTSGTIAHTVLLYLIEVVCRFCKTTSLFSIYVLPARDSYLPANKAYCSDSEPNEVHAPTGRVMENN